MAQYVTTLMSNIGQRAIAYDIAALNKAIEMAKENRINSDLLCLWLLDWSFYLKN